MRRIFLVIIALCCTPLSAQSVQPTYDTIIYDSAGKALGAALVPDPTGGGGGAAIRLRLSDARTVFVSVSASDWVRRTIRFELAGCDGQAYTNQVSFTPLNGAVNATVGDDGVLYVQSGSSGIQEVESYRDENGVCIDTPATTVLIPVTKFIDLDSTFTPPFTIAGGEPPPVPSFSDVPESHPYFQFVELMRASGVTVGCGGGSFCVNAPITRGEMAVFVAIAMGLRFGP